MGIYDLLGLLHIGFESWLENEIYYLFLELINFVNKIFQKSPELIFKPRKILRDLQKFGEIPRDTLEHDRPNKVSGAHEKIVENLEHKD